MSYKVNGSCPDDELLAQKLLLKGCEPLPRRHCRPAAPSEYVEPYTLPKGFDDCKACFDLEGPEKIRWAGSVGSGLDFSIDKVLAVKKPGTIRIGLDIGGGVATFVVRMKERNTTIVTTSMNLNGHFNTFIASRGVVPLYISISQRLPFFDNTFDIVH
ncbi:hypothetical protein F0562_005374 [Nyssa sinensis]|uniref:Methyltransferase type 11 domain-containing protein n=1 Tax=Nyssa sinensis TaxID=561372 RepID=A0A5J5ALQ3_9ASTE|nr:hypothetical protein F0562_005374 [Nyssa sinensis]